MLGNAFFVAVEFALTRVGDHTEEDLRDAGLETVWEMTQELEFHLTGCQVGITFTSILLGVVAEPAFTALLQPLFGLIPITEGQATVVSVTVAVVIINLFHTVWGEQAPTYLGVEKPVPVAKWLGPPLNWWTKLVYPLIFVGDKLAKLTLRMFDIEITRAWVEEEAAGAGSVREGLNKVLARSKLSEDRRNEVVRAYEIGEEPVESIMIDRDDIVAVSTEKSPEENLEIIDEAMLTRYVVIGEDLDYIVGVLYLPVLFSRIDAYRDGEVELEELANGPLIVSPGLSISDFIDRLQEESQELAFICDSDRTEGILTATDAFESMFGELRDPLD